VTTAFLSVIAKSMARLRSVLRHEFKASLRCSRHRSWLYRCSLSVHIKINQMPVFGKMAPKKIILYSRCRKFYWNTRRRIRTISDAAASAR
jgi:hypothetical protein